MDAEFYDTLITDLTAILDERDPKWAEREYREGDLEAALAALPFLDEDGVIWSCYGEYRDSKRCA